MVSKPTGAENLTVIGAADWEVWDGTGLQASNRKSGVPAQLSPLQPLVSHGRFGLR